MRKNTRFFYGLIFAFGMMFATISKGDEIWKVAQPPIPGYAENEREGPWIRFLNKLALEMGVVFEITITPRTRGLQSVTAGSSDMIVGVIVPVDWQPFKNEKVRFSSFDVTHVDIFAYGNKKLDLRKWRKLKLATVTGREKFFGEGRVKGMSCIPCALRMVHKGRLDAFLAIGGIVDAIVKKEKIKGIEKTYFLTRPVKVLFRQDISNEKEEQLKQAFIRLVKSGEYEELLGPLASRRVLSMYRGKRGAK